MKTKVRFISDYESQGQWKEGDVGYIDGYCRDRDDKSYCMVVVGRTILQATIYDVEVISEQEYLSGLPLTIKD